MTVSTILRLAAAALAAVVLAGCGGEGASSDGADAARYPSKPIRVIVPFGPGGLADVTLRIAAEPLSERLGQRLVIENRPGAGGVAATSTALNAAADGHTLIVLTNGTTIAETLFDNLPYDVTEDLAPISSVAWFDLVLLTNPEAPFEDLDALLARGRAEGLRIATINPGSTQNLSAELFAARAGVDATIITYRTTPDVLGALLRGEVDLAIDAYTALKGAIDGGQARPIAVTGPARNPAMPDTPTVAEAGVADYEVTGWNALYAPAGTPAEVIATLNEAVRAVTATPEIRSQFETLGVEARGTTPEEIDARMTEDIAKWRAVIEAAEIGAP